MPFVRRQRKYYKDGIEIPESFITDFGHYKYYKNVVTTKYWKEVTTGGRELGYYCYYTNDAITAGYYYASSDLSKLYKSKGSSFNHPQVSSPSELEEIPLKEVLGGVFSWKNLTENSVDIHSMSGNYATATRKTDGDLYIDTTVTETVEGTPEDYTYTTEEVTPVEVTADDEYDYTEFVPSTQYDYHVDNNKLYTPTRRRREYYKYGTEPNVGIVGSPTIVDGVASGFTTANYLTTPKVFNPLGNEVECVFKINLKALDRFNAMLCQGGSVQFHRFSFNVQKDGRIRFYAGNGSTVIVSVYSNVVLEINKDYWLKLHIKDNVYSLYYSLDGVDYIFDNSVEDADIIREMTTSAYIGAQRDPAVGSSSYFNGSIDLTQSYIKINGEDWWHGTKIVKSTEDDYEWFVDRNVAYDFLYKPYEVITQTFNVSSELQTYVVPEGVSKVNVACVASRGGNIGGAGGSVKCDLSVTEGQTLYVMVGGIPADYNEAVYNASDIRIGGTEYENRIIIAGGGAGGSSYTDDTLCANVEHAQGINNGEGFVKISYIKELKK